MARQGRLGIGAAACTDLIPSFSTLTQSLNISIIGTRRSRARVGTNSSEREREGERLARFSECTVSVAVCVARGCDGRASFFSGAMHASCRGRFGASHPPLASS